MKTTFKFTPNILLVITLILAILASFFQINPAIDTGREFYIPLRMLNGDVLYKDIFNIYGPLAYQINTFIYMILGISINSLRFVGILNSCLIIFLYMKICNEIFPQKQQKFVVNGKNYFLKSTNGMWQYAILPLIVGVCSVNVFNYSIPYSFSMTYGLSAFLASLYFFIKFTKYEQIDNAYLACLLAGGAISCKYDFFLYGVFLFLFILVNRKISTKNVVFSLLYILLIPFISYGLLFLQGINFENLKNVFCIIGNMSRSHALRTFYSCYSGTYFKLGIFIPSFIKTILFSIIIFVFVFARKTLTKDKFLNILLYIFFVLCLFVINLSGYALMALINFLIFLIFYKRISQNKTVLIFMFSTILFSVKVFFNVNIDVYGTYFLPLIMLSILSFAQNINYTKNEKTISFVKSFISVLIICLMALCGIKSLISIIIKSNGISYINRSEKVEKSSENIINLVFFYPQIADTINETAEYIRNHTSANDSIIILPETMYLNFITERNADNSYDSLTPMYFEVFGEEKIINHFTKTAPEYILLNNRDTSDYGKKYICDNYGKQFCKFLNKNYTIQKTFGKDIYIMKLYKKDTL